MAYTNSPLVAYTNLSPNHSGQRTHSIDRITPHCVVGQLSAESICGCFTSPSRQASCNYGIGTDGRVSLCVEEKNRSWCSSSNANDQRAVTIECASDKTEPYAMNGKVYDSLVSLCADICRRNGKTKLLWLGDKDKTLNYAPKSDEMVLTVHRWFANKSCPGNWLYARLGDLAEKVTAALGTPAAKPTESSASSGLYRVRKTWADSKSQKGAFSVLANAKRCADSNSGYSVFGENGNKVYPAGKSVDDIAREVIRGDWGNGDERRKRLAAAGYDYSAVQKRVNELLK
ncbi:MAG: N-acetylmuramoyl-L-alanine amidase [Clostridium sp.]|nr:N-acetylmuramoyl-L-alanine amidase [Clostridium sp.]